MKEKNVYKTCKCKVRETNIDVQMCVLFKELYDMRDRCHCIFMSRVV